MALTKIKKIRLLVHRSHTSEVSEIVQKLGVVEFTQKPSQYSEQLKKNEGVSSEYNYVSSRLDFAVKFLSRFDKNGNFLKNFLEGNKIIADEKEIKEAVSSFYFNDIIEAAADIEENINDIDAKNEKLKEERLVLENWRDLDLSLKTETETKFTQTLLLQGKKEEVENLERSLEEKGILFDTKEVGGFATGESFTLTFLKEKKIEVEKLVGDFEIEIIELPKRRGTPEEEIERIERALVKNEERREEYQKQAEELAENLPELKKVADYMRWKKQKHALINEAYGTKEVVVFEGWCPENKLPLLEEKLLEETQLFSLEEIEPEEGEVVPVEIENGKVMNSFEPVTRLYGLPGNKDLDPTPYLAGFFFVFFGICLSDVGYGLIITLLTGSALWFYNLPKETAGFFKMLMAGGISSMLVGFLFGGYFGIDPALFPQAIQQIQFFDPISNPLPIFYMALGLGVVQIILGMILSVVRDARNGKIWDGIFNVGPWFALFVFLGLWSAESAGLIGEQAWVNFTWLIYASILAIVVSGGRHYKGMVAKVFMGILGLYNAVGYLSDVLSYSRLLALGLATSALAFSVNLIASMANDMVPYVGWVFMIVILIVGHLFNLVANVLAAFIHTARLQFVEFFGKFITGSGKQFRPFSREEINVFLKDKDI